MNEKWAYWVSGVVVALVLFSGLQGWAQSGSGSKPPVITHAFTVEKIMYGDILKVYIEAEDPHGEMFRIAAVVNQAGYGRYPTSWVYVKPKDRQHLKGYLQWNTFSTKASRLSEWTHVTLMVSVFNKSGNESSVFTFPISFETGVKRASSYPVPPPFNQNDVSRLGFVNIDLVDPSISGINE